MLTRRNIIPKTWSDTGSIIFLLTAIPLIYWFELWVVLPDLYRPGSFPYIWHFTLGTFILINIMGNFTYAVLCDTSVHRMIMPFSQNTNVKDGWRFCATCESLAPPRSWHCETCKTCILKRDHHCIFTGCCIGHYNQRYFLMFILYLFVSTLYAFFYNNYFIWKRVNFEFPMSLIKIVFPLAMFVFGIDGSLEQFYLILYIIDVIGMLFTGILCVYHFRLVLYGVTANESNKKQYIYNLGWKQNLKQVFGDRWYLIWLLPYMPSKLPQDGVTWYKSSEWSKNSAKYK